MAQGYNEVKYLILKTLFYSKRYLTPTEISQNAGDSLHATTDRLTEMFKWGYIWRRQEYRDKNRNEFCYKFLKPKGINIFYRLDERVKIRETTGIFVSLNLKKPIPPKALILYQSTT